MSGAYKRERWAVHRKVFAHFLSPERIVAAMPERGERRTLTLLGGRACSGKEWFSGRVYDPERATVLSAEAVDRLLPEYEGWNAGQVRGESNEIINNIADVARMLGCDVVLDVTLTHIDNALLGIGPFKRAGYRVEIHYMFLPRQEAARRAVERATASDHGRHIAIEAVLANKTSEQTFDVLKKWCDRWSFYDNNVADGQEPMLVSEELDFGQVSLLTEPFPTPAVARPQTKASGKLDPNNTPDLFDEYDFNDAPPWDPEYLDVVLPAHVKKAIARRSAARQTRVRSSRGSSGRGATGERLRNPNRQNGGGQPIEPHHCVFWRSPERIREGSLNDKFDVQETYIEDSHWRRLLLKCRECGQLYFYEMHETVDYSHGEDPMFRKYIPIASADDAVALLSCSPAALNDVAPCLRVDWPSNISQPKVFWKRSG